MQIAGHQIGNDRPLFLIAGPCVIEDDVVEQAGRLAEIARRAGIFLVFKASYDKANRTSVNGFRGPGIKAGLRLLAEVKRQICVPVLTDVHETTPVDEVAAVVDVLQTPAFLVRQTDFIQRVARANIPMHVKKGQFLAPWEMDHVVDKCRAAGNDQVILCERGASFGYNNLVADMRSLAVMRRTGCPVVFDATHSVQLPGARGGSSGGQREMVPVVARAAVGVGVAGIFMETHPDPDRSPSDGPNMWPLDAMEELIATLIEIDAVVKRRPFAEAPFSDPSRLPSVR